MMRAHEHTASYYLADILGAKVTAHGRKIGRLSDLIMMETQPLPEVTMIFVRRPFGQPALLIPWDKVRLLSPYEVVASIDDVELYEAQPKPSDILLKDHVLDKKILDLEDREVEIIYDVKLLAQGNKLKVTHVNISHYRFLRRLGIKWLAKLVYFRREQRDEKIPWEYVQTLPEDIGSFRGDVKLNVLKERLSDMHPADMADILEELASPQRIAIFGELESTKASETLEEIEPNVQRDIVSSLSKEKVAQLIAHMTPAQASDVLAVLPHDEKKEILYLLRTLNKELSQKAESILSKQEEYIVNYSTRRILRSLETMTVKKAHEYFDTQVKHVVVILYLYVVDEHGILKGVMDLKELLQADERALLKDIMKENPITIHPQSTLKNAVDLFLRYDFRAIPVTDEDGRLLGAIPYRDAMNLKHRLVE